MIVNKWNFQKRVYEPHSIPDDWNIGFYSEDMDEKVQCAGCGKVILYGDSYTSMTLHTNMGFGYCMCEDCHRAELEDIKHEITCITE